MSRRATFAIVEARLRAERRTIVYVAAAAAVVGFVAPHGLAGPVFFCSLLGIVVALVQSPGRFPHLDLSEQGAPLFGRQLARAKALVPCVVAALATLAYVAAAGIAGLREIPATFAIALAAVVPSTLTALSATIRSGPSRMLYVVMACVPAQRHCVLALDGIARSIPGELGFAVLASFLALRQYGEALARYDPV